MSKPRLRCNFALMVSVVTSKRCCLPPPQAPTAPTLRSYSAIWRPNRTKSFVFDGGYWKLETYHAIADSDNDFVTKRGGNIQPQSSRNFHARGTVG